MPAFQRYPPSRTYASAVAASGFSTNDSARRAVGQPGTPSGGPSRT